MITHNNTFYHNNFVNNKIQAWDTTSTTNTFDNGNEGNYWSCYNGTDANNDGVGDTPHRPTSLYTYDGLVEKITKCSPDNFPLMAPFNINSVSIELPEWVSLLLNPSAEPNTPTPTPSSVLPEPEPFPTMIVAAVFAISAVTVVAGLLVYFKKRKQ